MVKKEKWIGARLGQGCSYSLAALAILGTVMVGHMLLAAGTIYTGLCLPWEAIAGEQASYSCGMFGRLLRIAIENLIDSSNDWIWLGTAICTALLISFTLGFLQPIHSRQ